MKIMTSAENERKYYYYDLSTIDLFIKFTFLLSKIRYNYQNGSFFDFYKSSILVYNHYINYILFY